MIAYSLKYNSKRNSRVDLGPASVPTLTHCFQAIGAVERGVVRVGVVKKGLTERRRRENRTGSRTEDLDRHRGGV